MLTAEVEPEELLDPLDVVDEDPLLCVPLLWLAVLLVAVLLAAVLAAAGLLVVVEVLAAGLLVAVEVLVAVAVFVSAAITAPVEMNMTTAEVATHLRMACVRRRRAASRTLGRGRAEVSEGVIEASNLWREQLRCPEDRLHLSEIRESRLSGTYEPRRLFGRLSS